MIWLTRILLLAGLLVAWELAVDAGWFGRTVLTSPAQIVRAAWTLSGEAELIANLMRTGGEVVSSFALAVLIGLPFGLVLWRVPTLFRILGPFLSAIYAVPLIFFYPLLLAWFGLGPGAIIAIAATTAMIPITLNTRVALLQVRELYWKLGRLYHCTDSQFFRKLLLPAAAPYLLAGAKLGFVYAMIGAIAMEFVLTDHGVGHAVRFNYDLFRTDQMYVYICLIIGVALLCQFLFAWIERGVIRNQITQLRTDLDRQTATSGSRRLSAGLGMAGLALAFGVVWQFVAATQVVPSPSDTVRAFGQLLAAGSLVPHISATLQPTLLGFGLAFIIGSSAGAALGRSPYWRQVWEPILTAVFSVPKTTLLPLFILLFGLGFEVRVVMAFVHAVFPILIAVMTGVKELNPVYAKLARTVQASPLQIMTKIYLPALIPELAAAVRLGLSLAFLGVVLSELFASKGGLGYLIMDAYAAFRLDQMFAILGLLYAVAFAFTLLRLPISIRRKRTISARARQQQLVPAPAQTLHTHPSVG